MPTCPCQTAALDRTGHKALACVSCGGLVQVRTLVTHTDHQRPTCGPCGRRGARWNYHDPQ